MKRKTKGIKLLASLALTFAAGALGGVTTSANIPNWYAGLQKPSFNPPNEVFGPVWTVLYILIGVSLFLVWTAPTQKNKRSAYIVFGVQLALNALWYSFSSGCIPCLGALLLSLYYWLLSELPYGTSGPCHGGLHICWRHT